MITFTVGPDPKPQFGIWIDYKYLLIDKVEKVWIGYSTLYQIANSVRPAKFHIAGKEAQALVQAGWLVEHEKPHQDYYSEPFWPSAEFLLLWPSLHKNIKYAEWDRDEDLARS
jgi:hypothetical protein